MKRSKFQAPRVLSDFAGVVRALREVQESLDSISQGRAELRMNLRSFNLVAGNFQRASAPAAGMQARLPKASGENLGEAVTLHLEDMLGQLDVFAAPGDTVNGLELASYTEDGVVVLWSNGVNAWSSVAQLPTNSPAAPVVDAEYVLGAAHPDLPNGREVTNNTEISVDVTGPGIIAWALNIASVAFSRLHDLTGLSVLGRAANSTGVMAAITSTAARQTLRNNDAGTALEWGHPVEVRDSTVDQGDAFSLNFVAGSNCNIAATVAAGVATITPSVDLSSVTYTAGDGIDLTGLSFSADVSDFAGAGIEDDGANNLRIAAAAAGAGLTGGGGSALAVGAGSHIAVNANDVAVNVATLVPAIDGASVVANGSVLERAALTGAIAAAQESNQTLFSGIRNNGAGTTDRSNLNFINSTTLNAVLIDDAGSDEIEIAFTVNLSADFAWTGVHSHTGASHTINVTGAVNIDADAASRFQTSVGNLVLASAAVLDMDGATGATLTTTAGNVAITAGAVGAGALNLTSSSADIQLAANTSIRARAPVFDIEGVGGASAGFLTMLEGATGGAPSVASGDGLFGVQNQAPTAPYFKNDLDEVWGIGYRAFAVRTSNVAATNATTNLSCVSFTIPANTLYVGALIKLHGWFQFLHTAAATPTLTFDVLVNGAVLNTFVVTPVATAATWPGRVEALLCIRSIGAGGTLALGIQAITAAGTNPANVAFGTVSTGTHAINTTVNRSVELRCRMTTAVAGNTLTVTQGYAERLA